MNGFTNFAAIAAIVLSLGVVVGCGGGGGGGGGSSSTARATPTPMMSNFPVASAAEARSRVMGSMVPTARTNFQLSMELETITTQTDRMIHSGLYGANFTEMEETTVGMDCVVTTGMTSTCTATETGLPLSGVMVEYNLAADDFTGQRQLVMEHRGVTLGQSFRLENNELVYQSYGGWLEASAFEVDGELLAVDGDDYLLIGAISAGDRTGSNLSAGGTWEGVMVGAYLNRDAQRADVIQGDARVTANIIDMDVNVSFINIVNLDDANSRIDPIRFTNIGMGTSSNSIPVGEFLQAENANMPNERFIEGAFYGADHSEVGGVFGDSAREIGDAFGAARQ